MVTCHFLLKSLDNILDFFNHAIEIRSSIGMISPACHLFIKVLRGLQIFQRVVALLEDESRHIIQRNRQIDLEIG